MVQMIPDLSQNYRSTECGVRRVQSGEGDLAAGDLAGGNRAGPKVTRYFFG